ncbi:MAG: VacJ family lipoprotein [Pseudomonadales bacterium]|nr:VacJ family lipoprotein [Pseudomonadales bacterium]
MTAVFRVMLLLIMMIGTASLYSSAVSAEESDPFESVNRKVFKFNDWLDRYTIKPLAKVYKKLTPKPINSGITHFFSNLNDISVTFNDLLQLKFAQAGSDSLRFLVNTSIGLLGTVDVASRVKLPKHNEDFGQTLGKWGVSPGPYIVLPLLGPFTARRVAAYPVDNFLSYYPHVSEPRDRNVAKGTELVDKRASLLAAEAFISGDRYAFVRDAYLQQREYLMLDGTVDDSFLDYDDEEFDDEEFDDDEPL